MSPVGFSLQLVNVRALFRLGAWAHCYLQFRKHHMLSRRIGSWILIVVICRLMMITCGGEAACTGLMTPRTPQRLWIATSCAFVRSMAPARASWLGLGEVLGDSCCNAHVRFRKT